uniref:Uncharacterized protein n=2 Tax=Oryza TaxID=4527 RepID=A0A679B9Q8_9ORYZ|nr:hypothetical protein [Oryza barthii]BBF89440.1 hypothetical protein [Oryza glaberrima]
MAGGKPLLLLAGDFTHLYRKTHPEMDGRAGAAHRIRLMHGNELEQQLQMHIAELPEQRVAPCSAGQRNAKRNSSSS